MIQVEKTQVGWGGGREENAAAFDLLQKAALCGESPVFQPHECAHHGTNKQSKKH